MADKRIQDLPAASHVGLLDRFVLEQNGAAMSLPGQILVNDLADALDGHGGIADISYTPPDPPSLSGTLTITMADETVYTLVVTNGRGITNITWVSSGTPGDGLTHTGTIHYDDGTDDPSAIVIQDGVKGNTGAQTYVWIKWAQAYPTQNSDMQNNAGPWIGIYSGLSSTAPSSYTDYVWYEYKGEKGDTGSSIQSIELTSTTGLVDTYTVTLTDGNTTTFTVTNAKSIVSITMISGSHAAGSTDVYEILFNDGDTAQFSVYNGANGLGSVSSVSGIQADGNGDVPQVISGNGAPTTATVGQLNQLYFDQTGSKLYYCAGESGGTYVWLGTASITVDSSLSGSSANPVQNKVITARVGTGALPNSNTNLTDAVNYVNGRIPAAASAAPDADTSGGAAGTGTAFARNDHRHELNVPTGGVPADLGTASQGSANTYSRSDHVHKMPSAPDVGALSPSDVQYKVYDSVADLGLTSGSATIAGAWSALGEGEILICDGADFASGERPASYGTVEIVKVSSSRGYIYFHGKEVASGDYRMFLNSSSVPDGTWHKETVDQDTLAASAFSVTGVSGGTVTVNSAIRMGNIIMLSYSVTTSGAPSSNNGLYCHVVDATVKLDGVAPSLGIGNGSVNNAWSLSTVTSSNVLRTRVYCLANTQTITIGTFAILYI